MALRSKFIPYCVFSFIFIEILNTEKILTHLLSKCNVYLLNIKKTFIYFIFYEVCEKLTF